MLGLGASLSRGQHSVVWLPSDESSLEAWYRNKVGIILEGSTENVNQWTDQSGNGHHMVQADTGEQPVYGGSDGALTFDPASDTQNLAAVALGDITLDGSFVIGIKMNPSASGVVVLGSNLLSSEGSH